MSRLVSGQWSMVNCRSSAAYIVFTIDHWLLTILLVILCATASAQTLKRAEYFFDTDPGKGNGTSLSITQAASINQSFNINISSLTTGTHTFNIRFVDSNDHWSLFDSRTFFVVNTVAALTASTIKKVEYFFDNDPGTGKATAITISAAGTQNNTFVIGLGSLTQGFHQLAIRYQDNIGRWSLFTNRTFYIVPLAATASSTTLKKVEYFFDTDPGVGLAKPLAITAASPENNLFAIDISSLTSGFHQLAVRYQDNVGKWSLFANRTFYIVPTPSAAQSTALTKAEYFFDIDPGVGLGKPLTISSAGTQNNLFQIDISSLSAGFHQIAIRYKDNKEKWSLFTNRTFYIVPNASATLASSIKRAEYFFDTDPGVGQGTAYPIIAGNPQNDVFAISVNTISSGFHELCLRVQDNLGRWSTFTKRTFYVVPGSVVSKTLQRIEYFVDTDPGIGSATSLSFTPAAQINQQVSIDLTGVSTGSHTLYLRTKDSQGYWSTALSAPFSVLNCVPPTAPIGSGASRCGTGIVTLNATGATGSQIYRWYSGVSTTGVLSTGTSFTTSSITKDSTYFTSLFDPATGCESSRTAVTATIVNIPKPTLNLTGSLAVCAGNTEVLAAPAGFAGYTWSNGLTTAQITVSTSDSYSVTVTDGTCVSPASDPFVFTVNPLPAKPVVNATNGGTLCGGGTVTLSGPVGFPIYSWSSGQSSSSITTNSPGDFFVSITDANGCQSIPSDVFSVNTSSPAKPVINVTGNTTLCNNSTVNLSAPTGFSGYTWSNGSTSQTITVSSAGNYAVNVSNGNCSSPLSDSVKITTAVIPAKPSVQITGSAVLCNNSFVGLSAPTGFSSYLWSDGETSKQIVVSTAGNYSVQVGNTANCLSATSDPVNVILSGQPCGSTTIGNPTNTPPSFATTTIEIPVETKVVFDITSLITKGSVGIDFSTLRITQTPARGKAIIDANYALELDYTSLTFIGKESVGLQVCDSLNSCTQQSLTLDVVGDVEAFNAVSPYPDGKNDFFYLKFIDQIEETKSNKVTIVDRWGNEVFSISDYNNTTRVFKGIDKNGNDLPSGTYYYRIDFSSGRATQTGFISLKR